MFEAAAEVAKAPEAGASVCDGVSGLSVVVAWLPPTVAPGFSIGKAEVRGGAADGDGRKLGAVSGVAAEGAEREVAVQIGSAQLEACTRLDVAGEQRERHFLMLVQCGHELSDAGHDAHAIGSGVAFQDAEVQHTEIRAFAGISETP